MTMYSHHNPRLLFTITGVNRENVTGAETMRDALRTVGVHAGLVITAQAPDWKLRADSAALEFVHDCVSRRHELLLGGMGITSVSTPNAKGEFHRLGGHESRLHIAAARRQLSALGLEPDVFAPEKWVASEESIIAARTQGLGTAADAYGIRDLRTGRKHNVRVLAFGDGFGAARWWRKNVGRTVDRMAARRADVRLSIHANKTEKKNTVGDLLGIVEKLMEQGYTSTQYGQYVAMQREGVA